MVIDTGLLIILLIVLAIFAYAHLGVGRQKTRWSQFANRHGLGYEDQGFLRYPLVWGTVNGRSFKLTVELVEMFTIRTGRSFMVMSLEIKGNFFCNMVMKKADTFLELHYLDPGPRFKTGNPLFDDMSARSSACTKRGTLVPTRCAAPAHTASMRSVFSSNTITCFERLTASS